MTYRHSLTAFSLVETVVALGIFAFCIIVLLGVFPIGMRATRSVANEANAIHIQSSVLAAWKIAPNGTTVNLSNIFPNLTITNTSPVTNYYSDEGKLVSSPSEAAMEMGYQSEAIPNFSNTYKVDLNFRWPVNASTNIQQTRSFSQIFTK
jgi:uncharacterized protein (TIGR02598 family)